MSDLTFPMIWCAGQVTIVCAVSVMSVQAVLNRRPELASRMAAGAVAVVWLVTLLIPLQLPTSMRPASLSPFCLANQTQPDPGERDAVVENDVTGSSIGQPQQLRAAQDYYHFDPRQLIAGAMRLGHAPSGMPSRNLSVLLIILGLGVVWSLVRLAWGVMSLRALVRSSVPIDDQNLIAVSQTVQKEMKFRGCLNVRESAEIDCAAVVGVFRSVILLSPQWREWNEDEQRAVLAHEMAHLCRRDSLWRLVASGCLAIHFYHPFLRRLAGRLVLAQELAADQLAMTVAGGRQCYLRSLSRLALRQDEGSHVRVLPLFTPVFSGHWIRRIEMLKAMDCKQRRSERRWLSVIMVTSIALFGLATTVIRAVAQSDDEQATTDRSAAATTLETISATAPTTLSAVNVIPEDADTTWQSTLFRNQKISVSHPMFSDTGAFHLDVAALRRSRSFSMCVEAFTAMVFSDCDPPEHWDIRILDALDSVTADATLSMRSDPEKKEEKNNLLFGFSRILATTNRDVAWKTLFTHEFPEIVDRTVDERELLEANVPALGPYPIHLMPISPRSIALGLPVKPDGTTDALAAVDAIRNGAMETKDAESLKLSDEWNAVSGGVLALVATIAEPQPPLIFDDMNESGQQQLKTLAEGIDMASLGIDVGQSDRLVEAKLRLRCKEDADSGEVLAAVKSLVLFAKKEAANAHQNSEPGLQEWHQALQSLRIELIAGPRNVVECQFRVIVSEELLQMIRSVSSLSAPRQAANSPLKNVE